MNKKITAIVSCGITAMTSVAFLAPNFITHSEFNENGTYAITEEDRAVLIGIDNPDEYFLGVASQFSVFVQGDFKAEGSDCEGRLAAGGSANLGESTTSYSVGAKLENQNNVAQIVVGGNILQHFEPNKKNFVAPLNAQVEGVIMDYMNNGSCKVYEGELFNFDEQFALLNQRSNYLKNLEENVELEIDQYYNQHWTVTGENKNLNVLNLTPEQYAIFQINNKYIQLDVNIPLGSYLVINVPGTEIELPATLVKVDYTDDNSPEIFTGENLPVLYNLPEATQFKYTGSIQGSTLAPNADATGDEGGHVAGMTIAKSFDGGIQFGYSTFNPKMDKMSTSDETTTTTTETTTTTTEPTTTTTTETTTTTTEPTTTTTTETTTTTTEPTTTTTTETTTTTTEPTTTTTTETTTTTTEPTTTTTTETTTTTTEPTTTTTTETTTTTTEPTTTTTTETTTTTTEPTTTTTTETTTTTTEPTTTTTTVTTTTTTTEATTTTKKIVMDGENSRTTSTTTEVTTSKKVMDGENSRTTSTTTETTTTTTEETTSTTDSTTTTDTTTTTDSTTTTTDTTTSTSTTITTTTTANATTTANGTTTNNDSPKTGDKGIGALIALLASSFGLALSLRKKED